MKFRLVILLGGKKEGNSCKKRTAKNFKDFFLIIINWIVRAIDEPRNFRLPANLYTFFLPLKFKNKKFSSSKSGI